MRQLLHTEKNHKTAIKSIALGAAALLLVVFLASCHRTAGAASVNSGSVAPSPSRSSAVIRGTASYYGSKFAGRKTASGAVFDPRKMTAAHRSLPFGTILKVTNLANNKTVVVEVNDRGPYAKGRVLDLSKEAAKRLGFLKKGTAKVAAEIID